MDTASRTVERFRISRGPPPLPPLLPNPAAGGTTAGAASEPCCGRAAPAAAEESSLSSLIPPQPPCPPPPPCRPSAASSAAARAAAVASPSSLAFVARSSLDSEPGLQAGAGAPPGPGARKGRRGGGEWTRYARAPCEGLGARQDLVRGPRLREQGCHVHGRGCADEGRKLEPEHTPPEAGNSRYLGCCPAEQLHIF